MYVKYYIFVMEILFVGSEISLPLDDSIHNIFIKKTKLLSIIQSQFKVAASNFFT